MKFKLKRIAPLQAGKILGVLYGAMSLLVVPFFALISGIAAMAGARPGQAALPLAFGVGMMVLAPILYAAMGFITGVIGAWLYNVVAGWLGGFELEMEPAEPPAIWPNLPRVPPAP